jgi:hypothetical protein
MRAGCDARWELEQRGRARGGVGAVFLVRLGFKPKCPPAAAGNSQQQSGGRLSCRVGVMSSRR